MFTTPETSSDTYIADALPVITSMRSTRLGLIELRSIAVLSVAPATRRLPLTSTSVRFAPRLRRSTRASPPLFSPREPDAPDCRSEEHTSELQSLMRISYAVFCLKQKKQQQHNTLHS